MKGFRRTLYEGEDREVTVDWIVPNPNAQACDEVVVLDGILKDALVKEFHGVERIDTQAGLLRAKGIDSGGVLHCSARIVPATRSGVCRVALCDPTQCLFLEREGELSC